jgi:hypothetical protein
MRFGLGVLVITGMLAGLGGTAPARADEFWTHWGDGKAELSGFALTQPRYGHLRQGTAVMIFVTEDFVESTRVKAEKEHPKSDVHPVLKLNVVRDFQTGIYDYNVMTSTFARTEFKPDAPWPVDKTSFSSQEWCGHVFMQWIPRNGRLEGVVHSYFDGEEGAPTLPLPPGGVLEDEVPILVRGLRGAWLPRGQSKTVPFLPSQLQARLSHKPSAWGEAVITHAPASTKLKTVLGEVEADTYTVAQTGGDTVTWTVETAAPHHILAWSSTSGEAGRLTGTARLPYWQMNGPGGEAALKQLGLKPGSMLSR